MRESNNDVINSGETQGISEICVLVQISLALVTIKMWKVRRRKGEGQANKKNIVYWRSEIGTTMKIKT